MTGLELFTDLIDALDLVVLERLADGSFALVTPPPDWFFLVFPEVSPKPGLFRSTRDHPFLFDFIKEANRFWDWGHKRRFRSGPWFETDAAGRDTPLEASALHINGKDLLLIERLGADFNDRRNLIQAAREGNLTRKSMEVEAQQRNLQIRRREEEIAFRLIWASESRDDETGAHIKRIGLISEIIAQELGWDKPMTDDLRLAASMHDLGKIGIPDGILHKPGPLSTDEFGLMKTHTAIGARMLDGSEVPLLKMAREIALHHHERWDGRGYPQGMRGPDIPASARIVAIADVYDALVNERVYRQALDEEEALKIILEEKGRHFDPKIFEIFMDRLPSFRRIQQQLKTWDDG